MTDFVIGWLDPQPADEVAFAQSLLPAGFHIEAPSPGAAASPELLARSGALLTQHAPVSGATIEGAAKAGLIQRYGRRADGIDLSAAAANGTTVATMPLRGCIAVAEQAMTLVLALSKQLVRGHHATVSGAYRELGLEPSTTSQASHAFQWMKLPVFEVHGRTLGIVGYGEIGTEASIRARAFGMNVLYTKRTRLPAETEARYGVEWAELDALLAASDFVLLSMPHTPETERLVGVRELALMQESAFLVNIARGGLVDESALVEALREGRIAGAGLDVFVEEPVPWDNALLQLDNVIVAPHIGGGSGGARVKQMSDALENIVRFARGETPLNVLVDTAGKGTEG
jgi:phosphoglycerate dehydrogenase-like enzyme